MSRKFDAQTLVLATHNAGKVAEFQNMISGVQVISAGELGLSEPVEDGDSFFENALIKARAGAKEAGLPCLADDSGLCVNALGGRPGIYSARWAGEFKDFRMAMELVQEKLGESEDRSAYFVSVLVLAWPDGHYEYAEGRIEGELVWPARGKNGFGYDPIFVPEGETQTFGEMSMEEKKKFSHRARAMDALKLLVF